MTRARRSKIIMALVATYLWLGVPVMAVLLLGVLEKIRSERPHVKLDF